MSRFGVHAMTLLLGASAGFGSVTIHAQSAAAGAGCPQFHCAPEATGVMKQPIVGSAALAATITRSDTSLGTLYAQGCSGDGVRLACLVDSSSGTLKIIDTTQRVGTSPNQTMPVVASDALLPSAKQLKAGWSHGQVPFMFSDGIRVGAGDAISYKIYSITSSTTLTWNSSVLLLPVNSNATTMGLTDLANGYGVVSRTDGVLTFIDMASGAKVGSLTLKGLTDPVTSNDESVTLSSPPSATSPSSGDGVLYVVANGDDSGKGFLYAVSMSGSTVPSTWNWRYEYDGITGASPVVATSSATGYSNPLILLHAPVPTTHSGSSGGPELQGIIDNGSSPTLQWFIPLTYDLNAAPTVDEQNQRLYLTYPNGYQVFGYSLNVSGTAPVSNTANKSDNLQTLTGLTGLSGFRVNGHIGAIQAGLPSDFTVLLAGRTLGSSAAEYMVALRPTIPLSGGGVRAGSAWYTLVSSPPATYAGAWNLSPSSTSGTNCPVVVEGGTTAGTQNGVVLMCDH